LRNKYGAKKTVVDGIKFDSQIEARRYLMLKAMQEADEIYGLELQPSFSLYVNGFYIGKYTADFEYHDDSGRVVEDVKGMAPDAAVSLRLKLMKACHDIDVQIWPKRVRKPRKAKRAA
jgi:hypothetical protein